jgi:hypothetical protein
MTYTYRAFGVDFTSDHPLTTFLQVPEGPPRLAVRFTVGPLLLSSEAKRVTESDETLHDGRPEFGFFRLENAEVLRVTDAWDLVVTDDSIEVRVLRPALLHAAELFLFSTGFVYWLERRGTPVLHAAAVEIEGAAIIFLASKGTGKSSLAVTFMENGYRLVSDDLVAIDPDAGSFSVRPSYPQVRLWPDQADRLLGAALEAAPVHASTTKLRLRIDEPPGRRYCSVSAPLRAIFLLQRSNTSADGGTPLFQALAPAETLKHLLAHSFEGPLLTAADLELSRFQMLSAVARRVPMTLLQVPDDCAALPAVVAQVAERVAALR